MFNNYVYFHFFETRHGTLYTLCLLSRTMSSTWHTLLKFCIGKLEACSTAPHSSSTPQCCYRLQTKCCPGTFVSDLVNCIFGLWDTAEVDFKGEKLKNVFQGQPGDLQHVKNVLPHTSQFWWHQLLATPLLLDWSMMRHMVFKCLQCGRTNLLNILSLVVYFSVALKKDKKYGTLLFEQPSYIGSNKAVYNSHLLVTSPLHTWAHYHTIKHTLVM